MKAEPYYEGVVIVSSIEVFLTNIEWQMRYTKIADPYFKQLSMEKYALESLRDKIISKGGIHATDILEDFVTEMNRAACGNTNPNDNFVFSVSRDAAQSILDGLYFD